MILSFHPCFEADKNIICAGRLPNGSDVYAIKKAKAVILPQGCSEELYRIARQNCNNVFPNFDARFLYPGKTGQIKLFRSKNVSYPESYVYNSVSDFIGSKFSKLNLINIGFPFVFKFDWGGEGETVFLVRTKNEFKKLLDRTILFEQTGHYGFLIQKYIESDPKTLRVVVIGKKVILYWKVQPESKVFGSHLASGAYIEKNVSSTQGNISTKYVKNFCVKTGINLAGFDLIFSKNNIMPFLLEINYFFGRQGLGGIEKYYGLLCDEIQKWINSIKLI